MLAFPPSSNPNDRFQDYAILLSTRFQFGSMTQSTGPYDLAERYATRLAMMSTTPREVAAVTFVRTLGPPTTSRLLQLVNLVVQGLQGDPEFLGGGGFIAVVFFQDGLDELHLDVAEGRRAVGDGEVGAAGC